MPTPDEYRRLAAECLELAPNISSDLRGIFVSLAQGWARLAEFLDEDSAALPDPPPAGDGGTSENSDSSTVASGDDWVE